MNATTTINPREHLRALDGGLLTNLLNDPQRPCVSIYMNTHEAGQQTRENPIRYKALLQEAHEELARADRKLAEQLVGPAMSVVDDYEFWQHQLRALAVFVDRNKAQFVRLPRPVGRDLAAVADSFHVKPLVRQLHAPDRYQLLAITQKSVALYEGDRDHLDLVPLSPDVPRSLVEAIGGEVRGNLNVSHYGGLAHSGMFHGHHDNRDDRDMDLERYFRVIDRAIYDHHGKNSDLPLFLAADVDYHDRFRKVSHHPRLQAEGVRLNPEAVEVDAARLKQEMNKLIIPAMHARTREVFEHFGNAKAAGQGSDSLPAVAEAAAAGRVRTLIVNADQRVGGRIDPTTGAFTPADEADPRVDDALDDLAEMTLRTGGTVLIVPGDVHPTRTGVAAIFRY